MSMLLISHDLDLIKNYADRVIILKNGVLLEEGSSFEIFNMPNHDYTRQLIDSSPEKLITE